MSKPDGLLSVAPEKLQEFLTPLPVERLWGVGRVTLARMHDCGIKTVGDLARRDPVELKSMFGSMGPHLQELASGNDTRPVIADWQRKSYGEENTFAHDLALDSIELRRVLIAHGDAIARRLRADGVRARTITLKLKLARPLGGGRYPLITRSFSLDGTTNDGPEISRVATQLLSKVGGKENRACGRAGASAGGRARRGATRAVRIGAGGGSQARSAESRARFGREEIRRRGGDARTGACGARRADAPNQVTIQPLSCVSIGTRGHRQTGLSFQAISLPLTQLRRDRPRVAQGTARSSRGWPSRP